MERAEVLELIKNYNVNTGRAGHLTLTLKEYGAELARLQARLVYDETGPGAQNITGMPHGTTVGDPTAQVAIRLASGYETDEMKSLRVKMEALNDELEKLERKIAYVDAWLKGLNVYERWLILKQGIDETHWRDLEEAYKKEFGSWTSFSSLKRIRNAAVDKICEMAR